MADNRNGPAAEPPGTRSAPQTELRSFPNCCRVEPWNRFAARWAAKREDHDRFVRAIDTANNNLPAGWRLPDDLAADWLAEWADDLFIGIIPQHDRLSREEVTGAVEDVAALVEALRFVERNGWIARARRFWLYELADDPGLGEFPTVEEVQRLRPELDPRRGLEDQPGDISLTPRYDQRQFFERAEFLLGTLTSQDRTWLCRLAVLPDPHQLLWTDPPRHHSWVRGQLQCVIPELSGLLGASYPQIDDSLPITELLRRAHNWLVEEARPKLAASRKPDTQSVTEPDRSDSRTRAKQSTERGEGRAKLIAALTKHHRYAEGGALNQNPIGNNELARLAGVEPSTASEFFKKEFGKHAKYKALCLRDSGRLALVLKNLNGELPGHELLYGRRPAYEDDRNEE